MNKVKAIINFFNPEKPTKWDGLEKYLDFILKVYLRYSLAFLGLAIIKILINI